MTFVELLREEFEKRIKVKTGWGKNDVMVEFDKACVSALIQYAALKGIDLT